MGYAAWPEIRGSPGIAVATLALGIGVNATVFAIADGMLFKSMPFVSDRIVYLSLSNPAHGDDGSGVSYPDFRDWEAQAKSFAGMALFNFDQLNLSDKTGVPAAASSGSEVFAARGSDRVPSAVEGSPGSAAGRRGGVHLHYHADRRLSDVSVRPDDRGRSGAQYFAERH
jgi:hypothetical protein